MPSERNYGPQILSNAIVCATQPAFWSSGFWLRAQTDSLARIKQRAAEEQKMSTIVSSTLWTQSCFEKHNLIPKKLIQDENKNNKSQSIPKPPPVKILQR